MEYVACGSLESLLKKFGKFQESSVQRYTRDIVRGLSYLHKYALICTGPWFSGAKELCDRLAFPR